MNNLFQRASSHWVRYSEYEYRHGEDGVLYLTPASKAKPDVYDPLTGAENMVLDMLNVGMLCMNRAGNGKIQAAVLEFVSKYGLLGFMAALPTIPQFMDYNAAYFPKNHFIREESMPTDEYAALYFPFDKPDFHKGKDSVQWNVTGRDMMALTMAMGDKPMALNMSFLREYAERYDWLVTQFKDWAFTFTASFLYYEDYDKIDETTRDLYRQGMAAFGGIAPTYHIALYDRPTIVWDFHSLLLGVQMMFSFMLTNEKKPLRACKHCMKVFAARHPNAAFCSPQCKNQYNVYKSRAKKDE
ncbi:hypothetical protein LJC07_00560 [Christensenellaceae bacterium OttesenSCG-928-L17]|nr:hypothetical protein [Christensenellaceae bacterium OttesenSCG-928-L17]